MNKVLENHCEDIYILENCTGYINKISVSFKFFYSVYHTPGYICDYS